MAMPGRGASPRAWPAHTKVIAHRQAASMARRRNERAGGMLDLSVDPIKGARSIRFARAQFITTGPVGPTDRVRQRGWKPAGNSDIRQPGTSRCRRNWRRDSLRHIGCAALARRRESGRKRNSVMDFRISFAPARPAARAFAVIAAAAAFALAGAARSEERRVGKE